MSIYAVAVSIPGKDTADGFSRTHRVYLNAEEERERFLGLAKEAGLRVEGFVTVIEPTDASTAIDAVWAFAKTRFQS